MATSLDNLNYRNLFAPDLSIGQNLYASFQQGRDAVNSVFEQQRQQQLAQARLDAAQQQLALNAQLAPYQAQEAQQQNLVRQHQINQFGTSDALASENLARTRNENNWYSTTHPSGGYVNADALPPLPEGAGPVNPSPLMGQTFTSTATGYHPVSSDSPDYKMEGGILDAQGNKVFTLDAYRRGEVPYVTAAIDKGSPLFGQSAFSPTLNAPIHFTDTGSAFRGKGNSRVDIARDDNTGALSNENNGPVQFNLGNVDSGSASTLTAPNQTSVLDVAATSNAIPALAQSDISQPIAPIGENSPLAQSGMIAKRVEGIQTADRQFIPGGQPRAPGDKMAYRNVMVPSLGQVAADDAALKTAEKKGANGGTFERDDSGYLTQKGRTDLAAFNKNASAKGGVALDFSGLDNDQQSQARSWAREVYGPYASRQPDALNNAAQAIREGKDIVHLRSLAQNTSGPSAASAKYSSDMGVRQYQTTLANYKSVADIADKPQDARTIQDDISLLFAYVKADNPTMGVSEGSFKAAAQAGTFGDEIKQLVNRLTNTNQKLADQQVKGYKYAALNKLLGQRETYLAARNRYGGQIEDVYGQKPEEYIGEDLKPFTEEEAQYARKGGNIPSGAQTPSSVAKPTSKAEYDTLPSGTRFIAPDGTTRVKP